MTSKFGWERIPTEVQGSMRSLTCGIILVGSLSSATPTGEMPMTANASTKEYSNTTILLGAESVGTLVSGLAAACTVQAHSTSKTVSKSA
ncbi:hypothetical protein P4S64_07155 [Vibrio sp. M60_M31a]